MLANGWANPFEAPGQWRRANLHTHTTASDGRVSPQERVSEYARQGYDVLAITDHHAVTGLHGIEKPASLLLVPGAELHPENPFGGATYHFICLGVSEALDARKAAHPQEVIDYVGERGGLVYLAHPYWCRHALSDLAPLKRYAGVEVYNVTCGRIGRSDGTNSWDALLNRVGLCPAIACDDCHAPAGPGGDAFGAWTWVKTETHTAAAFLAALREGRNYSSCGPEIRALQIEDHEWSSKDTARSVRTHKIRVKTSPARAIFFLSDLAGGRTVPDAGSGSGNRTVEEAEFIVRPNARYVRVEVEDEAGRKAWSNPIPFRW